MKKIYIIKSLIISVILSMCLMAQASDLPELEESYFVDGTGHLIIVAHTRKQGRVRVYVDGIQYAANQASEDMLSKYLVFSGKNLRKYPKNTLGVCLTVNPSSEAPAVVVKFNPGSIKVIPEEAKNVKVYNFAKWKGIASTEIIVAYYNDSTCVRS